MYSIYNYDISFQRAATPVMEGIVDLHHTVFFFIIVIFVFVMSALLYLIKNYSLNWTYVSHVSQIEQRSLYKYSYNLLYFLSIIYIFNFICNL